MAKFEVLHCITEVEYFQKRRTVDKEGSVHLRQELMHKTVKPAAYGCEDIHIGDIIEITKPHLVMKARNNPWFQEVKPQHQVEKKTKKKVLKKT